MERLDYEKCLTNILADKIGSRTLSKRNSRKIADLCTPERMAGLDWMEAEHFVRWIASLAEPAVGRELLRKILANPESLPHDVLARLVAAPIFMPRLPLDGSKHMDICPLPDDIKDSANPADAILKNVVTVLRGFQTLVWGVDAHCFHVGYHDIGETMRFRTPEIARLAETDSVDVMRMLADIRQKPMPIAHMFHLGGPKCRKLLLRPETYVRSDLTVGSLATYAVMGIYVGDTLALLSEIEAENPGLLRTVKDAAGHNLLWYLGFRKSIFVHETSQTRGSACRSSPRDIRDFLIKAKCDKKERDIFGVAWKDIHWKL